MTSRAAVSPVAGSDPVPGSRWPFSIVDELNCYLDSAAEPNNVHLEAWLPGRLSADGLRRAVAAALADLPQARARRAAGTWWRARYAWECPPAAEADPVSVATWQDEADLDAARGRFLAASPSLDRGPLFRLLLAQGPGRDCLILNAHHAAFDGRSCLRLLSLIAGHYDGPPAEVAAPEQPGPASSRPASAPPATGPARPARASQRPGRRTARIAAQHAGRAPVRGRPGHGVSLLAWPDVPTVPGATVNDLLIAALIQAVASWNAARGQGRGQVKITMPVDTRVPGQADEVGNLSRLCTVTVDPLTVADITAAVASQTRQAKSQNGPAVGAVPAAVARSPLPAPVQRWLLDLATRTAGRIGCDTTLLSNLGNITEPPRFAGLSPTRMWFSTSAHMPRGLSVGVVTVAGRLQVSFRYRNALLDAEASRAFAAEYATALSALADGEARR